MSEEQEVVGVAAVLHGDTFAHLAGQSPLGAYAEAQLRLRNDRNPDGNPLHGQSLKVVK